MVVRKSVKTLFKHPKLCLPFVIPVFLLFGLPLYFSFLKFFPFLPIPPNGLPILTVLNIFLLLLIVLLYLTMNEVCILMVHDLDQNERIHCFNAFKKCFSRLPSVLVSSLLVEIIVSAGMLAFVIPGIYLMCRLSLSEHATAIEEREAIESLERSWDLTRGRTLEIFRILLLTGLFSVAIGLFSMAIFFAILTILLNLFPLARIVTPINEDILFVAFWICFYIYTCSTCNT